MLLHTPVYAIRFFSYTRHIQLKLLDSRALITLISVDGELTSVSRTSETLVSTNLLQTGSLCSIEFVGTVHMKRFFRSHVFFLKV